MSQASDITEYDEIEETIDYTDVNRKIQNGWRLLAVLQNTSSTERDTFPVMYVIGKKYED